jgi:hypothetical protein
VPKSYLKNKYWLRILIFIYFSSWEMSKLKGRKKPQLLNIKLSKKEKALSAIDKNTQEIFDAI